MREFYKNILLELYLYCGNRQFEKLTDAEVEKLCDILEKVSKIYSYIPEEKQKEIIETQLLKDTNYQNINARLISSWFEQNGKMYFSQDCHKPAESNVEPLTGEAREQAINMYLTALRNADENFTQAIKPKGSGTRLRESMGVQPFVVEGLEIYAKSQAEAETIYNQTVIKEVDTKPKENG